MKVNCELKIDKLRLNPAMLAKTRKNVLNKTAFKVMTTAKQLVSVPQAGRHSKPGEAPRLDTGTLKKSILYRVKATAGVAEIGAIKSKKSFYAHMHEWGGTSKKLVSFEFVRDKKGQFVETRPGSKKWRMKKKQFKVVPWPARPFMRPALEKVMGKGNNVITK